MEESTQPAETNTGNGRLHSFHSRHSDHTPRSETPSISVQPTPKGYEGGHEDGYFALRPSESYASASTSSVHAPPAPSIASSTSTSSKIRDTILDATRRLSAHIDATRPHAHRDSSHASVQSTDSTATIKAHSAGYIARTPPPGFSFPNQSYAALHQQTYPPPHLPPNLRTRSLYPTQPVNFSSAIAALHNSGSRTADSSPTPTPGLFDNSSTDAPPKTPSDDHYYPSPYLHWSHRQAPKETHVADVDVDPISGRKIINEYEIIDELGRGTHGKVKLGRNLKTGEFVAIKIVERYSKKRRLGRLGNAEDKVKREVAILKKARHPNIVALLEVIDDPARKKVYIVLERVDLGEIAWRVESPREIGVIESRRYDREASGIFDDPAAEEEEQAVFDLARLRRAKETRAKWRKTRKMRKAGAAGIWSIEFGGDTDDEESELNRTSSSTASMSEHPGSHIERIMPHAATPSTDIPFDAADQLTPIGPTASPFELSPDAAEDTRDPLEGTMYGSYDEAEKFASAVHSRAESEIRNFGRTLSQGNLMEKAVSLLDGNMHPDLLYVPCMTLQAARIAFRDTVMGLQYLHYQGIIHRDIKPPNLLQTRDRRIKISDFGVSYLGRPIDDDKAENLSECDAQDFDEAKELAKTVGTAAFYAPELCYTEVKHDSPPVGKAIDVWALGITLFCMLFGRVPFIDQEYVVMRRIADEEIYIPSKRLRPIDSRPKSRPSSHGRHLPHAYTGTRAQYDLEYETIDDTLLDLLRRLLTKDPRKRITLEEVRHHPWVVSDINDKAMWLDETDPSRQSDGKKIEVSKEELNDAVVPIQLIDRIRSGIKKAVGSLGLGRSSSNRKRAGSTVTSAVATPSASSSSSNISVDGRRKSLRGDESIYSALKASREGEHPLSQSVTASPEQTLHDPFFAHTTSLATPRAEMERHRPGFDRSSTAVSTANSIRTVRPTDPGMEILREGQILREAPPSPDLSAASVEHSPGSNFGGLLSGAGRLLKSVRDRSTAGRSSERRERSGSNASSDMSDAHADASLAISTASASGHLDPPQALQDITPTSAGARTSPTSRHHSLALPLHQADPFHIESIDQRISRNNSANSLYSTEPTNMYSPSITSAPQTRPPSRLPNESTDEDFQRAESTLMRRRIAEDQSRPASVSSQGRPGNTERVNCPPSPDDEAFRQAEQQHGGTSRDSIAPSLETSPASPNYSLLPLITPSSSKDRFAHGVSSSMSNPTIPSAISGDFDSQPLYAHYASQEEKESPDLMSSGESIELPMRHSIPTEEEEYHPDSAIQSDDDDYDDDSSDEDGGLTMMRRKSAAQGPGRSISVSNAQLARYRGRKESGGDAISKKSSRSGSNNTMKKVRSHGDSDSEDLRGRPLSSGLGP